MPAPAPAVIVRTQPAAECESLRYVVGYWYQRPVVAPVFGGAFGRTIVDYRTGPDRVEAFRVVGFGSTLQAAERRAARHRP